jgi:hypothetical protein
LPRAIWAHNTHVLWGLDVAFGKKLFAGRILLRAFFRQSAPPKGKRPLPRVGASARRHNHRCWRRSR